MSVVLEKLKVVLVCLEGVFSRTWLAILQGAAVLALGLLILHLARHEAFAEGVFAVFLVLALPAAAFLFGSRRILSFAFVIGAIFLLIETADAKKWELLYEHLNVIDVLVLWDYVKNGDSTLVQLYPTVLAGALLLFCAILAVAFLLRFVENKGFRSSIHFSGSRIAFVIIGSAAVVNAYLFVTGNYFYATSHLFVYSRTKAFAPLRVSYLLSSVVDVLQVSKELDVGSAQIGSSARASTSAPETACSNCPDIITVHVESVFDPFILQDYANVPPLTTFFSSQLNALNGPLRTHVVGGWSMISEFSFNCGVDHRVFGTSGIFPNLFLPNSIKRCIPGYLRDNGYKTEIVSSAPSSSAHIGAAYKAYGVDHFYGPGTLQIPTQGHWRDLRDGLFVDATIELLQRPRVAPRLVMLLTAFNHGPHGNVPRDQSEIFPGPYDLSHAGTEELRDYMNRLNDLITAFRRLEEYLVASNVPTVIIYYGDHQPSIKLNFSAEALRVYGSEEIRHVTFYRIARNFRAADLPEQGKYLGIRSAIRRRTAIWWRESAT